MPSALEEYLLQAGQPVNPVQYSDEARKRAMWEGVLQAGLAMMADQGKVFRTKGEANASGISSLGKAGLAGFQGYKAALGEELKAKQVQDLMGLKLLAAKSKPGNEFKTATIEKPGPDGKPHYFSMNPKTGMYDVDQGLVSQGYKMNRPVGRSSIDNRVVYSNPEGKIVGANNEPIDPVHSENMKPLTVRGIEAGQASELANLKNTYDRLGSVRERALKMPDKFGPVSGRWNNLKVKFVNEGPTQSVINELKSMITIAYGLSGKQISEGELKMLQEAMLPRLEQPDENFLATLDFARNWVGNLHDDRIDNFKQAYFDLSTPYLNRNKKSSDAGKASGKSSRYSKYGIKE